MNVSSLSSFMCLISVVKFLIGKSLVKLIEASLIFPEKPYSLPILPSDLKELRILLAIFLLKKFYLIVYL